MRAAQLLTYKKDFQLQVRNVPKPNPQANEVLVRIKYAAVNPLDTLIGTGSVRLIQNYRLPLTMGNEFSGVVEAVGANVTRFQANEAVYARLPLTKIGAFAEYVAVDQAALARMPKTVDFAQAAAIPLTGLTAYQGLHEELNARPGQRVMIPGGSGSFGQLAVPLAKAMGLTVAVSGNGRKREEFLALGADRYFDYSHEDYWEQLPPVDFVIDTLGQPELSHELAILKPGGRLLSLRMGPNRRFADAQRFPWWKKQLFTMAGRSVDRQAAKADVAYHFIFVRSSGTQLAEITRLVEETGITPAIDARIFTLNEANSAVKLMATGHPQGKVLIKVGE